MFPLESAKGTSSLNLFHTDQIKRLPQNFQPQQLPVFGKQLRCGNGTSIQESIFKFLNALKDDPSPGNGDVLQTVQLTVPLSLHSLTKWDFKSNFPKYHYKDIYV